MKIWSSHEDYVGTTKVLRALPHSQARAIGPFVFLDHFGPNPAVPGILPAHPHAGIEVMTYLLAGSNEHRDSAGHMGRVKSGGAQYMRAGRGVLHSERILDDAPVVHGLQFWARMSISMQDDPPAYRAIAAEDVPFWTEGALGFRLLAGEWRGMTGPVELCLPAFMLHMTLEPGAEISLELPEVAHEYGVYAVESPGDGIEVDRNILSRGAFAQLKTGQTEFMVSHNRDACTLAEIFVLGGEPAPRPLVFGGSFVFESQTNIQRANQRYARGEMGTLDGVPF